MIRRRRTISRPGSHRTLVMLCAAVAAPPALGGNSLFNVGPNNGNWDSSGSPTPNWFNQTLGNSSNVPAPTDDVLIGLSGTNGVTGVTVKYNFSYFATGIASLRVDDGNTLSQTASATLLLVNGAQTIGVATNGAYVQSAGTNQVGSLILGSGTAATGTYSISGGFLFVSGTETIGAGGFGTLNQTGGSNHAAAFTVGSLAGSFGTATLSAGTLRIDNALTIGDAGIGAFNYNGGTVTAGSVILGNGGGFGSLSLSNSASLNVANQTIGNGGFGSYSQASNAVNTATNFILGNTATGNGTATISGGRLTVASGGTLSLGLDGIGKFFHSGGTVSTPTLLLGAGSSGNGFGFYSMSNNATLIVNGNLTVGQTGLGVFNQTSGTTTISGAFTVAPSGSNNGFVTITGGNLSAASTVNNGLFTQVAGSSALGALSGSTSGRITLGAASGAPATMTVTSIAQSVVTINSTGSLVIATNAARLTHTIGTLALSGSGTLDISNHDLVLNGTYATVNAAVRQAAGPVGANGLNRWSGSGITSSVVKTDASLGNPGHMAIGVKDNADYVASGNSGKAVAPGKVLVSYAAYGDANLDNTVDISDLSIWNNNFNVGDHWGQGDFNYDGKVDIADLSIWNNNFAGRVTPAAPAAGVSRSISTASSKTLTGAAVGAPVAPATPQVNTLELDIDASTGDATINSGGVSIAAIEIDSAAKDLITANWKSFKNFYHVSGWSFAKGVPNTAVVAEFTSDASSSGTPIALAQGSLTDYGNIVPVGFNNQSDLTFKYNIVLDAAGNTQSKIGNVVITGGVPEPTSLGLLALIGAGLLKRRRRA